MNVDAIAARIFSTEPAPRAIVRALPFAMASDAFGRQIQPRFREANYLQRMNVPEPTTPWRDALWTVAALALLLAWDIAGADLHVVRLFGGAQGFEWRNQWALVHVFHEGGRWLSALAVGVVVINVARPWAFARNLSLSTRWWWCAATAACLLLIPTLKHFSKTSCPWDLAEFGGSAHYVSHWVMRLRDGGPGGCFPAGHASAAFSFFSGWFALRSTAPKAARRWLAGVWICGIVFGVTQLLRGAHYPSHTLWTAWMCWTLSAVLWHAGNRYWHFERRKAKYTPHLAGELVPARAHIPSI